MDKKYNSISDITNLYSVNDKTMRFKLEPRGNTIENIKRIKVIEKDKERASNYDVVKSVIDDYHKEFIDERLRNFKLDTKELEKFEHCWRESDKKKLEMIKETLRKKIVSQLTDSEKFKRMFNKYLIREDLVKFEKNAEKKETIKGFRDFTVYFDGLITNRKNMYSSDAKSTGIAYRLIDENLPIFVKNMDVYNRCITHPEIAKQLRTAFRDFKKFFAVDSIEELFVIDFYSSLLTQKHIDAYNNVIGGYSLKSGRKIKGLNEIINLEWNQKQQKKSDKLPLFNSLKKQILSDKGILSWLPENFKDDEELINAINTYYSDLMHQIVEIPDGYSYSLLSLLEHLGDFDLSGIFIKKRNIGEISQRIFGNHETIEGTLKRDLENHISQKKRETDDKYNIRRVEEAEKKYKQTDVYSLQYIDECLQQYNETGAHDFIVTYFKNLTIRNDEGSLLKRIEDAYKKANRVLSTPLPLEDIMKDGLNQRKGEVKIIMMLLEEIQQLKWFLKPLVIDMDALKCDSFYDEFYPKWEKLNLITTLYNKVASRLTRKPYSNEKFRLNFQNNGKVLSGWPDSQTQSDNGTQYGGYLFRKSNQINEYDYYLGISKETKLFREDITIDAGNIDCYERLDYYQVKEKTFYGKSYVGSYSEDKKELVKAINTFLMNIGRDDLLLKNATPIGYLHRIKNEEAVYHQLLDDSMYVNASENMKQHICNTAVKTVRIPEFVELSKQCMEMTLLDVLSEADTILKTKATYFRYFPVRTSDIEDRMNDKSNPLFLFKISNKDLSYAEDLLAGKRKKRGKENLHTMYFKALMEEGQSTFDIGSGSVFFREASINYSQEIEKKGHHYNELKDKFAYPIISNRRYTHKTYLFHLSMVQNFQQPEKGVDINPIVNQLIRDGKIEHIIGIDRGERNLLYITITDLKGNIVKQESLNKIKYECKGKEYATDYQPLLKEREIKRNKERRTWDIIEPIKDLKQGFISQAVHVVSKLMVEYNAIVVMEDLPKGFKNNRRSKEVSIYQQFENALLNKLNYLVDKDKAPTDNGGVYKGLQLTNRYEGVFDSSKERQNGCVFYVPAWKTSQIDPVTGFVNLLDTKCVTKGQIQEFIKKFDDIRWNGNKGYFEFVLDYAKFGRAEGTRTEWTLCTFGSRIENKRNSQNKWESKEIENLYDLFIELFVEYHVDYKQNLKDRILAPSEKRYYEKLMRLIKLTLQLRNTKINDPSTDYILSPVADDNGEFFDSRNGNPLLPKDADANGAYNVARKGLWLINQIRQELDDSKLKLMMSNRDWLNFAQEKLYMK